MASTKTKNILITMMLTMSSVFLIGSILLLSRNAYAQTQPDFNIPDEINNEEIPAEEEQPEEVEQEVEQEEALEEEVEESSNTKTYQYTGYDDVHEVVSEAVFLNPYNLSSPIGKIIVEDNQTTRVQFTRFANNNHEILKGNNNNEYTNYLKSRIGIIYTGNNIILAGTGITLSTTNIRNIFAFSNALFTPLSSNTFYINAIKGLGINGPSIKSGVNVHGIVKITNNLGSCNANNKGAISTMKRNNLSCLVGCKNDRGQWTLLDKSEECQKLCYQFRQICELIPSNNTNLEPQNAQCTGFTLGQNMTACSSQSDLLSKYKNIKFIGYFTEHCPVSNETNMVNPCAYSCRSGFTPSDDKKSCICKQTTQACPVIDTQKEKRFDHQLDDENAIQSQSACSQTKLQANECKTTTYYTYKCKAGYKRNSEGTACEAEKCGTQDNPWIWSENKVGACTDTIYAPYNLQGDSGVGYDFKYGCRRKNYRPNQGQQDPAKCYGKCPENMKWDDVNKKCINTPPVTCTGTAPSGAGVITGSNTPDATTSWSYTDSSTPGACQWTCKVGHEVNSNKTGCYEVPRDLCSQRSPRACRSLEDANVDVLSTGFNQSNFTWYCKLGSTIQQCEMSCDMAQGSTLHNEYCAKQYKRECSCDNEGEGNGQVCRELNENECKDIVSYNGECYSYSPHGEQIFNTTNEPCYYCAGKLGRIEIWNNDNQDCRDISHDGLTVPCLGGGTYALKSYSECSTANDECGTGKYSHCKLDGSDSELSENICEAICVDEGGRLVDESLCNAYTRPQCTGPSPDPDPSYCNHCAKNGFPYCFPIDFDPNCKETN